MQARDIATKLDPRFKGPCRVISIEHGNKLKMHLLKNLSVKIVHLEQLKRVSRGMDSGEELLPLVPLESITNSLSSSSKEHHQKLRSSEQIPEQSAIPLV